jgi:monofunctional glycosyltransferase
VVALGGGTALADALIGTEGDVARLAEQKPVSTRFMRRHLPGAGSIFDTTGSHPLAWTRLDEISPFLLCSVVKAEDTPFFEHRGFVWSEIGKAAWRHARGQRGKGGSSITQQLAKNLFLTPERTLRRKTREALITAQMERTLSKARILELYLNVIEWGDGVWGVTMASQHYFGKAPADLDTFESVFLASLVPAPRAPLTGWNLERAGRGQARLVDRLYYSGLISLADWRRARARVEAVQSALVAGMPLEESLRASRSVSVHAELVLRQEMAPLPLSRAFHEACGVERERAEDKRLRRIAPERQRARGSTAPSGSGPGADLPLGPG